MSRLSSIACERGRVPGARAYTSFFLGGVLALSTVAACGGSTKTTVDVVEANSSIAVGSGQVHAGKVTLRVRNTDTFVHQLVVVKAMGEHTDLTIAG
jgi:hypothetical protein